MVISPDIFKSCLGCFATGVTVVTTVGEDNRFYGITVNSFNSVSLTPPLILFSIDKSAHSFPIFTGSRHFAVNILSEAQIALSQHFSAPLHASWENVMYEIGKTGSPIIQNIAAYLECERYALYEGGDHIIVVGKVLELDYALETKPLLYHQGNYRHF